MLLAQKADLLKPGTADSPRAPDLRQTRPPAGARAGGEGEGEEGKGGRGKGERGMEGWEEEGEREGGSREGIGKEWEEGRKD